MVITAGGLDLSVGSMAALVSGLTILFLNSGFIDRCRLLIACCDAAVARGRRIVRPVQRPDDYAWQIEPFIVTLGTMGIFRSLLTWLAQGGSITIKDPDVRAAYRPVYFGDLFGVPYPVLRHPRGRG